MQISTKAWLEYINKMSAISEKAAELMQDWIGKHGFADDKALIDYAMALSTHYGEAIGALSCQMYEATALAQGVIVPAAEAAATPTYGEVAKAVYGTIKQSEKKVPDTVGRLVKQVGADTTLKNAQRDGAEFAWVPQGDTCAFCITLASRGWQHISKATLKKGHAEHIHPHCDCQYAVRFDGKSNVQGYKPEKYLRMYNSADPNGTPQEKINALRVELTERQRTVNHTVKYGEGARVVDKEYIKSQEYRNAFRGITGSPDADDKICQKTREILDERDGTQYETLVLVDKDSGNLIVRVDNSQEYAKINYDQKVINAIEEARSEGKKIVAIHNHPDGYPPTADDCESAGIRLYDIGIAAGHNGKIYLYKPSYKGWGTEDCEKFHQAIGYQAEYADDDKQMISIWLEMMNENGFEVEEVN